MGIQAYLRVATKYHLFWLGPTTLLCFSHIYAVFKLLELGIISFKLDEDQYADQTAKDSMQFSWKSSLLWASKMAVNLRCIGVKCGKHERSLSKPSKAEIIVPTLLRLGCLDVLTTVVHYLALYSNHLAFIERPAWQQIALTVAMALSLVLAFQGTYGIFEYIGIYMLDMDPSQWPPMLGRPWSATSLRQFWSKEWHSVFRRIFTFFSDLMLEPLAHVFKLSINTKTKLHVLGVFLMSALLHDFGLYLSIGRHSARTFLFFLIQGPGLLLEEFLGLTQRPLLGFLWTFSFLILTGGPFGFVGELVDYKSPEPSFLTDGFFKEMSVVSRIVNIMLKTDF